MKLLRFLIVSLVAALLLNATCMYSVRVNAQKEHSAHSKPARFHYV